MSLVRGMVLVFCASLLACVAATTARAHGDLSDRITNLTAQIKITPANAALYLERGELHRLHLEFPDAFADFDRAQKIEPRLLKAEFCRGRALWESGDAKAALPPLTRYLANATNDANAFAVRARVHHQLGNVRAAVDDFTRAIAIAPIGSPEFYIERAEALAASGAKEEALRGLDQGIAKVGPLITFQLQAIDLEASLKRYDAALKRIDSVAVRAPRKESWLVRRAEILKLAGRAQESNAAYREALAALDKLPNSQRYTRAIIQMEASIRSALREDAKPSATSN